MRIRNRTASILFKALISIIGCLALAQQIGLFGEGFKPSFFHYFTNLSNVAVTAYFIGATIHLIRHRPAQGADAVWAPQIKYATMMAVTVTCLIAHFLLGGGFTLPDGSVSLAVLALHYIVPIGAVLDWLLFDQKGNMTFSGPVLWVIFPLVYLAYVMIMVNVLGIPMNGFTDGRYPYPFIDVDARGIETVAMTCGVLVVAFIALGYVYVAIDRLLARLYDRRLLP